MPLDEAEYLRVDVLLLERPLTGAARVKKQPRIGPLRLLEAGLTEDAVVTREVAHVFIGACYRLCCCSHHARVLSRDSRGFPASTFVPDKRRGGKPREKDLPRSILLRK